MKRFSFKPHTKVKSTKVLPCTRPDTRTVYINCSVLFRLYMVALHFFCRRYLPSCTSQLCLSYKVLSHKVQAEHVEHITFECFATVELVLSIAHVQCLNCSMFVLGARQSSTLAA